MHVRELPPDSQALLVRPWTDRGVADHVGRDPRSTYVERFWLPILGPSTTWFVRHLVARLEQAPHGYDLDLDECARALGLGSHQGPNAAFPRTVVRACQFGVARLIGDSVLEVRPKLPPLTRRQVSRLPRALQAEHARWVDHPPAATVDQLRDRARRLALSLVELGEDREGTERQLHRWRFHPALASEATGWALDRHARRSPPATDCRERAAG